METNRTRKGERAGGGGSGREPVYEPSPGSLAPSGQNHGLFSFVSYSVLSDSVVCSGIVFLLPVVLSPLCLYFPVLSVEFAAAVTVFPCGVLSAQGPRPHTLCKPLSQWTTRCCMLL